MTGRALAGHVERAELGSTADPVSTLWNRIPHPAFRIPHPAFRVPHLAFRIPRSASRVPHPAG
ncbi:MAG: hypothetical protein QF642_04845 [Myxococcota bacterium]|nr:hypothetical protein [Myxococcota bacterium]